MGAIKRKGKMREKDEMEVAGKKGETMIAIINHL